MRTRGESTRPPFHLRLATLPFGEKNCRHSLSRAPFVPWLPWGSQMLTWTPMHLGENTSKPNWIWCSTSWELFLQRSWRKCPNASWTCRWPETCPMTGLSQWKPPSWCPDPQRPRWPCCTTCSTCVMGRFESMQVVGPSMNPWKHRSGPRRRSLPGMTPWQWKRGHIHRIRVATSWSFTPTRRRRLRTIVVLDFAPYGETWKDISLPGGLRLPVAVPGLAGLRKFRLGPCPPCWGWRRCCRSQRTCLGKKEDSAGNQRLFGSDAHPQAHHSRRMEGGLEGSGHLVGCQALHRPHPCSSDGPPHCDSGGFQRAPSISCDVWWTDFFSFWGAPRIPRCLLQVGALCCFGFFCGSEGGVEMQHWAVVVGRSAPISSGPTLQEAGLLWCGHSCFWLGSGGACGHTFFACSCPWRWSGLPAAFVDGVSWPAKATHHCGECHLFWAKTECGLVLSSVTPWEIISKEKGVTTGGYMCKHCQGFWKQGKGATRLVQIIGRHRGRRISQLIMDEPPEALYNQWIKDRIEYYKRVEPVAAPRDEQLDLGPPVARIRLSHSNDRCPVGQLIWQSILSNRATLRGWVFWSWQAMGCDCLWRCLSWPLHFRILVVSEPWEGSDCQWRWLLSWGGWLASWLQASLSDLQLGIDPLSSTAKKDYCCAMRKDLGNGMDVELSVMLFFSVLLLPQVDCLFFPCLVSVWLVFPCFAQVMMAQFKFPSPFSRAYLRSPQLLQDALARIRIGPFQTDGEFLCLMFLTPVEDEPDETGVTHRPWTTFSRVLNDLYDHPDQFKSVTPSDSWLEWLQELDEQAPFTPADKLDLMRSLWKLMENATDGKPSHTFSIQECGWELSDRKTWAERYRPPPITQLQVLKWRHWKPAQLKDLEPTTQRALEEKLRSHWANRLISHLIPYAAEIPAMAAVMGDGDDHQEFLHLLGDARFSTLRQRCLFFERLKKQDLLQVPSTESAVRQMLSKLQAAECTPNYIQQAWDTLKWFSSKFQTLDESLQRLQSKKKSLQEALVSTTSTPQRKAVVPSREVIWALEKGAAAVGAVSHSKGVQAREAIDAFIMGLVRFQVGCCARFNDMQHTSPGTLKVTTSTIEMMAWQTKTVSAFKIKKNPVPLIAPKLSLSGVDWWTDWVETLKTLFALERFQDMDYLIPTLSKDFQGVIPRPGSSDRSLRWLKETLIRHGVAQELVQPLSWHSFRVFIPDCAYQLGIPRTQRQYLGNWQTESTADIYTREKRNVVVDIWGKFKSSHSSGTSTWTQERRSGRICLMKIGTTSTDPLTMEARWNRGHFT